MTYISKNCDPTSGYFYFYKKLIMVSIKNICIFTIFSCFLNSVYAEKSDLFELLEELRSDDINISTRAAHSIASLGESGREAIPEIINKFKTPHGEARAEFITITASFGSVAVPYLIEALANSDISIRRGACEALGWIGADASDAIESLIQLLSEPGYDVSMCAASSLGKIGSPALPKIIHILKFGDETIRSLVVQGSFRRMPSELAVERHLLDIIQDKNAQPLVKKSAIDALQYLKIENYEEIISILVEMLGESSGNLGSASAHTLGKIGPIAAPSVIKVFKSENVRARSWATYAIKFMHPPVKEAVPSLILLLEDEDQRVRYGARSALERIGTPEAMEALSKDKKKGTE